MEKKKKELEERMAKENEKIEWAMKNKDGKGETMKKEYMNKQKEL